MAEQRHDTEIRMQADQLYREETYTDRRVGTLQILRPVKADGSPDAARRPVYVGQTQVLTPAGALPLSFELEAASLQEAVERFNDGAKAALAGAMQKLEELRREAASSIIVPGSGNLPGGGVPGGGAPGGGIQLP